MTDLSKKMLPTKKLEQRYDVVARTISRWQEDPELGFPSPMVINGRKYWDESDLIVWERSPRRPKVHAHHEIIERDDGRFEVGLVDPAGPFESRQHAVAVLAKAERLKKREVRNARTT